MSMANLTIGSVNCRGLASDEIKRRDIFHKCKQLYEITFLIDTHCSKEKEKQWKNEWGYSAFFASLNSTSRGVSIMFKNSFQYTLHSDTRDPKGNFIILDVSTQEQRLSLVALYGPNEDSPDFFENLKSKLVSLSNTSIIIGGDWNVVQDFNFDTDNYLHKNNLKSHDKVLEISSYLDLIDVWRKMNTEERRFTWHGPNRKQSRLDYFLISSDLEGFIKRSEI